MFSQPGLARWLAFAAVQQASLPGALLDFHSQHCWGHQARKPKPGAVCHDGHAISMARQAKRPASPNWRGQAFPLSGCPLFQLCAPAAPLGLCASARWHRRGWSLLRRALATSQLSAAAGALSASSASFPPSLLSCPTAGWGLYIVFIYRQGKRRKQRTFID